MENQFEKFNEKMTRNSVAPEAIAVFKNFYKQLFNGSTGFINNEDAQPINELPHIKDIQNYKELGIEMLNHTVDIKLNGGLGTSMGLNGPKSLLKAKNDYNFLEITINQIFALRKKYNVRTPLMFMNSFSTDADCKPVTDKFDFKQDLPVSFIENKVPKILKETLEPATCPQNPKAEWSPPGHGDVFPTLHRNNIIDNLIKKGYKYAFISNTDNLGAIPEPTIIGYMEANNIPFLMEVAIRTPNDKKGGHLAQDKNGQLILREAAQCPPEELEDFQNIDKYKFFNTNNIWINLVETKKLLDANNGYLDLPIIINEKNLIPTDANSPKVYQLESAMGSAIKKFVGSKALIVNKNRFAPIKKTNDLLMLWSDAYKLTDEFEVMSNMADELPFPIIKLDEKFYKFVDDLQSRFPNGAPSLRQCKEVTIEGDVLFGKNITILDISKILNPSAKQATLPDNTIVDGEITT